MGVRLISERPELPWTLGRDGENDGGDLLSRAAFFNTYQSLYLSVLVVQNHQLVYFYLSTVYVSKSTTNDISELKYAHLQSPKS